MLLNIPSPELISDIFQAPSSFTRLKVCVSTFPFSVTSASTVALSPSIF
ncbi:MAG: hypothetical protein WBP16_16935 [Ferruginibacter sp.]